DWQSRLPAAVLLPEWILPAHPVRPYATVATGWRKSGCAYWVHPGDWGRLYAAGIRGWRTACRAHHRDNGRSGMNLPAGRSGRRYRYRPAPDPDADPTAPGQRLPADAAP